MVIGVGSIIPEHKSNPVPSSILVSITDKELTDSGINAISFVAS